MADKENISEDVPLTSTLDPNFPQKVEAVPNMPHPIINEPLTPAPSNPSTPPPLILVATAPQVVEEEEEDEIDTSLDLIDVGIQDQTQGSPLGIAQASTFEPMQVRRPDISIETTSKSKKLCLCSC